MSPIQNFTDLTLLILMLHLTSHTASYNLSDISVSSVKTDDLRNSDEVKERNDQHEIDTPPTWNADKAPITVCDFEEPVGPTLTL